MVVYDSHLGGLCDELREFGDDRSVVVHKYQQRIVLKVVECAFVVQEFIGRKAYSCLIDDVYGIARVLYYKAYVFAHIACKSVNAERGAEAVHIRPCVAHDQHVAGVFDKLPQHVSHDAALAFVALFHRRKGSAVVLGVSALLPDDGLVASASECQVQGRCGSVLKLFERRLSGAYAYGKRGGEIRLGLDIVHGIEYREALFAKLRKILVLEHHEVAVRARVQKHCLHGHCPAVDGFVYLGCDAGLLFYGACFQHFVVVVDVDVCGAGPGVADAAL